jgi:beta-mannosidase
MFYRGMKKNEKIFTRKAQYQYGWDWGPRFVTCGIWKDVKILSWKDARFLNIQCLQKQLTDSLAGLEFVCEIKSDVDASAYLDIAYAFTKDLSGQRTNKIKLTKGVNSYSVFYDIKNPHKWWTNGLGFPSMYNFNISLSYDSRTLSEDKISIGLRTIELVQEPDSIGSSFFFKLNGIPVFMKGANYIPPDNFLPRVIKNDYKNIIKNAVNANMNMLRVWGGGVYADDQFYDECDKNGILVWQDFMFACAMYPGDTHFVNNVKEEITGQVKRLRNHPSIALWCGNNEINEGWHNWEWQKQYKYSLKDSTKIANDYALLFEKEIRNWLFIHDKERSYWPSSPSIGWGHNESLFKGDSHYWGVWWGMEPFDIFNKKTGRFMSEYGFQGMPDINTLEEIGLRSDISVDSLIFKSHQKHPRGYETIKTYMERDYKIPKNFENYVYTSQLLQAKGMKTAIEAHRRAKPYCMGTLYWQLNDCWPAVSWSTIDYNNNWKASHYQVRRSFENVLISVYNVNDKYQIHIINDKNESINCRLSLRLIDFKGNVLWNKASDIKITANSSSMYDVIDKKDFGYFEQRQTALYISVAIPDKTEFANSVYFFVRPGDLILTKPLFEIGKRKCAQQQCFSLSSDVLVKDVFITIDGKPLQLSDNYFDLIPNQEKIIYLPENIKIRRLERKIKIISMADVN